ncbi:hypothetical protein TM48_03544 [Mycobacterium shottsii]|uniref:Transmembrane protein n=1 Tax=Mycobacterium shottsii TaxID=133549 RepID=A0A7I7LIX3_9MYCO|nr:DUF2561 family protein [Mycobacterium shottsii]QYL29120.1 hypothetical protein TM48_03544 [Mycobacterium shottsii]BBX59309.1 hypothetical protein MSHO_46540 [Mycobacterium shottsii]
MLGKYSAYRRGPEGVVAPEVVDRILIGACAAVWLALVGVGVAAVVALADLGRGVQKISKDSHSSWVLYTVIVVSALIIVGAVPMLLRARRMAETGPLVTSVPLRRTGGQPLRTANATMRAADRSARRDHANGRSEGTQWSSEAVDRVWLRGTVALVGTIGIALITVGAATNLMAVGHDGASWVAYGLTGIVTAGMPAIEWFYVRQLRRVSVK